MNGEFLRGEVYWIRFGDAVGSEETGGRPGLIISGSKANINCPTVIVCFLSKHSNDLSIYPTIMIDGQKNRVLCNQIQTVDKARIERHIYTLTEPEMIRVGGALAIAMCIPQTTAKPQPVVEKPVDEKQDEEIASLRCESEMWRRMYEKVMDQLVEIRVSTAISQKMAIAQPKVVEAPVVAAVVETPVVVTEEPPVAPPVEPVEEPPVEERVDINHCTQTALRKIGFSLPMCRLIVSYRPFESVSDLKRVPGMKANFFRIVKPKLCCTPMAVVPEKVVAVKDAVDPGYEVENKRVNVNTATVDEMMEAGIYQTMAQLIRAYRNKNGPFSSVEDLLNIPRCSTTFLNRLRDKLEV